MVLVHASFIPPAFSAEAAHPMPQLRCVQRREVLRQTLAQSWRSSAFASFCVAMAPDRSMLATTLSCSMCSAPHPTTYLLSFMMYALPPRLPPFLRAMAAACVEELELAGAGSAAAMRVFLTSRIILGSRSTEFYFVSLACPPFAADGTSSAVSSPSDGISISSPAHSGQLQCTPTMTTIVAWRLVQVQVDVGRD